MRSEDLENLAGWYEAYSGTLMLYARQWLSEDEAQDAVQTAFVRMMGHVRPRDVKAWLFRTVRNEAITRVREHQRHGRHHQCMLARQSPWFEARPEDLIDGKAAQQVLMGLPEEQREVVLLRIWGQLALGVIAKIVGCPVSTVFSRYKAALAAVRKGMQSCKTNTD